MQIASLWQNVYRVLGAMPSIMVCGELDGAHSDFASFVEGGLDIESSPATKACQCFTRISQTVFGSQIVRLGFGEGYVAYSVSGLNIVFVHVPNRIATKQSDVELFYQDIASRASSGGTTIHLVIGDTNQSSLGFTEGALNNAFSTGAYKNALGSASVSPSDLYGVSQSGTNSTGTKMYDVAVYRSDAVKLVAGPAYISQMSTGLTVTDHCGVAVQIEKL